LGHLVAEGNAKLGVRSRTELARHLTARGANPT